MITGNSQSLSNLPARRSIFRELYWWRHCSTHSVSIKLETSWLSFGEEFFLAKSQHIWRVLSPKQVHAYRFLTLLLYSNYLWSISEIKSNLKKNKTKHILLLYIRAWDTKTEPLFPMQHRNNRLQEKKNQTTNRKALHW